MHANTRELRPCTRVLLMPSPLMLPRIDHVNFYYRKG